VYQFFWGDFCDWYIEWVKPDLQSEDRARASAAWRNLFAALDAALRLLHPFMPFITEELWHQFPQRAKSIALDPFPEARTAWKNAQALEQFSLVQELIVALRNIRSEMKLPDPKKRVPAEFSSFDESARQLIESSREGILRLALLSDLKISAERLPQSGGAVRSTALFDVRIPYVAEATDVAAEAARLRKQIEGLEKAVAAKEKQLANDVFRSRAPEDIVRGLEATLAEQTTELQKLRSRLEELKAAA
jgi:valyl-tRNA synthetase